LKADGGGGSSYSGRSPREAAKLLAERKAAQQVDVEMRETHR
jgi:hypothetical protein